MADTQNVLVEVLISPPIPPQPPRFRWKSLKNLSQTKSKINENSHILSLLHTQLDFLNGCANKVKIRIKEYESYSQLLQYHTLRFKPSINDLPPELLAIIFQYCCTGVSSKGPRGFKHSFDRTPWVFSWVCSSWRQLALVTPAIWSAIPGPLEIFEITSSIGNSLQKLDVILSRSAPASLQAVLCCDDISHYRGSSTVFSQLTPHLGRISDLNLLCELPTGMQKLFTIPPHQLRAGGLSALKSLSIEFSYGMETDFELVSLPPLLQKLPSLTSLTVRLDWRLDAYRQKLFPHFPWNQLASLSIYHETDYVVLRNILLHTPRLEELRAFEVYQKNDPTPLRQANQVHPNLRLLHLKADFKLLMGLTPSDNRGWIALFLKGLCLPALTDLSIRDLSLSASNVASFLDLSQCNLLQGDYVFPDPQGLVLQHCPGITKLTLGLAGDAQLDILSNPRGGTWPVPRLTTLILVSACISSSDILDKLIQARRLAPEVHEIDRIEMSIRFTDAEQVDKLTPVDEAEDPIGPIMEARVFYGNYDFDRHFKRFLTTLLRASCGYDLINMYNNVDGINHLGTLCNGLEKVRYLPITHDELFNQKNGLIDCMVKILVYLDQIEAPEPNIVENRARLRRLLCRWTHDPWALNSLPVGWTRTKLMDLNDTKRVPGVLVYTSK